MTSFCDIDPRDAYDSMVYGRPSRPPGQVHPNTQQSSFVNQSGIRDSMSYRRNLSRDSNMPGLGSKNKGPY
jgi:hypothetical protein